VLQFCYEPQSYARALLTLEQNRIDTGALALAATGKDKYFLLNRVKRILGHEPVGNPFSQKLIAYLLSTLLIAFIGWYNPGNIIIKKLDAVNLQPQVSLETPQTFFTPAVAKTTVNGLDSNAKTERVEEETPENSCSEAKDPYKKLAQIIELTTQARLAALNKRLEELPQETEGFVNNVEVMDYSLPENAPAALPPIAQQVYPYVPGSSFYFQPLEDTTQPKYYVLSPDDIKAKEAMEKSMQALQQMNWKKVEMVLKAQGMKINIDQIQQEMERAMQQVDWKKLNAETNQALEEAKEQVEKMQQDAFVVRLGNYQRDRTIQQERIKRAQQQILIDRLAQREMLKKMEQEKQKEVNTTKSCKKKKIVHI